MNSSREQRSRRGKGNKQKYAESGVEDKKRRRERVREREIGGVGSGLS